MKVLLAEYAVSSEPALADEGRAMLETLKGSFERCGHQVVSPGEGDFGDEICRLGTGCDAGLVIAPDHLLARYTALLEGVTRNLGCGSLNIAYCANKLKTGRILASHGIPVPRELHEGMRVIKPIHGCGSRGVRLSSGVEQEGEFGQEYIRGEHLSVSLIGHRLVGEACLYHTGMPPLVLAVNRQEIRMENGEFHYLGGETPVIHERGGEIAGVASRAATILGCQGYAGVDIVLADRPYVVDVNPRITTSVVGIAAVMQEEIADLLVRASFGMAPGSVRLEGRVRFTKEGKVTRL